MLMKILLTALVIAGAVMVLRMRATTARSERTPAVSQLPAKDAARLPKVAAYGALAIMLVGCALFVYFQWQDTWRVVTVRVVHSGTGNESVYQAYKGDIEVRSFITTDGRTINLAEVERMELGR